MSVCRMGSELVEDGAGKDYLGTLFYLRYPPL